MIKMENNNSEKKQLSRKWFLVLLVIILASVGTFVPPIVSAILKTKILVILSGMEWVSVISMVTAAYIGGNVWQKHIQKEEASKSE